MANLVEQLSAGYDATERSYILPTSKAQAIGYLRGLATVVEQMDDFARFPEGDLGVVVYAVLAHAARSCPDVGDFGHVVQGAVKLAGLAQSAVASDTFGKV